VQCEAVKRFKQGIQPVPLAPRTKRPIHNDWTHTSYENEDAVRRAFPVADAERNVAQPNIGVLTGRSSNGFVVADLDGVEPGIAVLVLPETGWIEDRPGRPMSHWGYSVEGKDPFSKVTYGSPLLGRPLVELLGDGQQVVIPPSLHESGERRAWVKDGEPAKIAADALRVAAGQAAALQELAFILERLDGQRHVAVLPIIGGLLRSGLDEVIIERWLSIVWLSAERDEIRNAISSTARKQDAGEPYTGWERLYQELGDEYKPSLDKILDWLGVTDVDLDDPRPRVHLDSAEDAVLAEHTWNALQEANDPPELFQRGGKIARVNLIKVREKGQGGEPEKVVPAIETVSLDGLRGHLSRMLCWTKPGKGKGGPAVKTSPPLNLLRTLHAESGDRIKLPVVSKVVSHPILGVDGSVRMESGYHAGSQTYLWMDEDLTVKDIPDSPTPDEVEEAKRLVLDELLVDFPFVDEASMAHTVALGLLPFGRNLIAGPTPMHFFEAPTQGTGKDLIVKSLGAVWNGSRNVPSMPQTGDEEEWRKAIISAMLEGLDILYIANIKGLFASRVLEQAITESETMGRVLKTSSMVVGEIPFNWIGTGNNATLGADIARRICPTRLDAKTSNPYARSGWKHSLPGWALEHRGELIWAFLTLWKNWLAKGRPRGNYTFGSFQDWADVIGGVLDAAGIPGFLENAQEFQDQAVDENPEWQEFITYWLMAFGTKRVKPSALVDIATQVDGFDFGKSTNDQGRAGFLSKALKARRGSRWHEHQGEEKVIDALTICMGTDSRTGRFEYWLEHTDGKERKPVLSELATLPTSLDRFPVPPGRVKTP
jgi:hypothetical protein